MSQSPSSLSRTEGQEDGITPKSTNNDRNDDDDDDDDDDDVSQHEEAKKNLAGEGATTTLPSPPTGTLGNEITGRIITSPEEKDILILPQSLAVGSRIAEVCANPGNYIFRQLLVHNKKWVPICQESPQARYMLCCSIVESLYVMGGRFLRWVPTNADNKSDEIEKGTVGVWFELSVQRALSVAWQLLQREEHEQEQSVLGEDQQEDDSSAASPSPSTSRKMECLESLIPELLSNLKHRAKNEGKESTRHGAEQKESLTKTTTLKNTASTLPTTPFAANKEHFVTSNSQRQVTLQHDSHTHPDASSTPSAQSTAGNDPLKEHQRKEKGKQHQQGHAKTTLVEQKGMQAVNEEEEERKDRPDAPQVTNTGRQIPNLATEGEQMRSTVTTTANDARAVPVSMRGGCYQDRDAGELSANSTNEIMEKNNKNSHAETTTSTTTAEPSATTSTLKSKHTPQQNDGEPEIASKGSKSVNKSNDDIDNDTVIPANDSVAERRQEIAATSSSSSCDMAATIHDYIGAMEEKDYSASTKTTHPVATSGSSDVGDAVQELRFMPQQKEQALMSSTMQHSVPGQKETAVEKEPKCSVTETKSSLSSMEKDTESGGVASETRGDFAGEEKHPKTTDKSLDASDGGTNAECQTTTTNDDDSTMMNNNDNNFVAKVDDSNDDEIGVDGNRAKGLVPDENTQNPKARVSLATAATTSDDGNGNEQRRSLNAMLLLSLSSSVKETSASEENVSLADRSQNQERGTNGEDSHLHPTTTSHPKSTRETSELKRKAGQRGDSANTLQAANENRSDDDDEKAFAMEKPLAKSASATDSDDHAMVELSTTEETKPLTLLPGMTPGSEASGHPVGSTEQGMDEEKAMAEVASVNDGGKEKIDPPLSSARLGKSEQNALSGASMKGSSATQESSAASGDSRAGAKQGSRVDKGSNAKDHTAEAAKTHHPKQMPSGVEEVEMSVSIEDGSRPSLAGKPTASQTLPSETPCGEVDDVPATEIGTRTKVSHFDFVTPEKSTGERDKSEAQEEGGCKADTLGEVQDRRAGEAISSPADSSHLGNPAKTGVSRVSFGGLKIAIEAARDGARQETSRVSLKVPATPPATPIDAGHPDTESPTPTRRVHESKEETPAKKPRVGIEQSSTDDRGEVRHGNDQTGFPATPPPTPVAFLLHKDDGRVGATDSATKNKKRKVRDRDIEHAAAALEKIDTLLPAMQSTGDKREGRRGPDCGKTVSTGGANGDCEDQQPASTTRKRKPKNSFDATSTSEQATKETHACGSTLFSSPNENGADEGIAKQPSEQTGAGTKVELGDERSPSDRTAEAASAARMVSSTRTKSYGDESCSREEGGESSGEYEVRERKNTEMTTRTGNETKALTPKTLLTVELRKSKADCAVVDASVAIGEAAIGSGPLHEADGRDGTNKQSELTKPTESASEPASLEQALIQSSTSSDKDIGSTGSGTSQVGITAGKKEASVSEKHTVEDSAPTCDTFVCLEGAGKKRKKSPDAEQCSEDRKVHGFFFCSKNEDAQTTSITTLGNSEFESGGVDVTQFVAEKNAGDSNATSIGNATAMGETGLLGRKSGNDSMKKDSSEEATALSARHGKGTNGAASRSPIVRELAKNTGQRDKDRFDEGRDGGEEPIASVSSAAKGSEVGDGEATKSPSSKTRAVGISARESDAGGAGTLNVSAGADRKSDGGGLATDKVGALESNESDKETQKSKLAIHDASNTNKAKRDPGKATKNEGTTSSHASSSLMEEHKDKSDSSKVTLNTAAGSEEEKSGIEKTDRLTEANGELTPPQEHTTVDDSALISSRNLSPPETDRTENATNTGKKEKLMRRMDTREIPAGMGTRVLKGKVDVHCKTSAGADEKDSAEPIKGDGKSSSQATSLLLTSPHQSSSRVSQDAVDVSKERKRGSDTSLPSSSKVDVATRLSQESIKTVDTEKTRSPDRLSSSVTHSNVLNPSDIGAAEREDSKTKAAESRKGSQVGAARGRKRKVAVRDSSADDKRPGRGPSKEGTSLSHPSSSLSDSTRKTASHPFQNAAIASKEGKNGSNAKEPLASKTEEVVSTEKDVSGLSSIDSVKESDCAGIGKEKNPGTIPASTDDGFDGIGTRTRKRKVLGGTSSATADKNPPEKDGKSSAQALNEKPKKKSKAGVGDSEVGKKFSAVVESLRSKAKDIVLGTPKRLNDAGNTSTSSSAKKREGLFSTEGKTTEDDGFEGIGTRARRGKLSRVDVESDATVQLSAQTDRDVANSDVGDVGKERQTTKGMGSHKSLDGMGTRSGRRKSAAKRSSPGDRDGTEEHRKKGRASPQKSFSASKQSLSKRSGKPADDFEEGKSEEVIEPLSSEAESFLLGSLLNSARRLPPSGDFFSPTSSMDTDEKKFEFGAVDALEKNGLPKSHTSTPSVESPETSPVKVSKFVIESPGDGNSTVTELQSECSREEESVLTTSEEFDTPGTNTRSLPSKSVSPSATASDIVKNTTGGGSTKEFLRESIDESEGFEGMGTRARRRKRQGAQSSSLATDVGNPDVAPEKLGTLSLRAASSSAETRKKTPTKGTRKAIVGDSEESTLTSLSRYPVRSAIEAKEAVDGKDDFKHLSSSRGQSREDRNKKAQSSPRRDEDARGGMKTRSGMTTDARGCASTLKEGGETKKEEVNLTPRTTRKSTVAMSNINKKATGSLKKKTTARLSRKMKDGESHSEGTNITSCPSDDAAHEATKAKSATSAAKGSALRKAKSPKGDSSIKSLSAASVRSEKSTSSDKIAKAALRIASGSGTEVAETGTGIGTSRKSRAENRMKVARTEKAPPSSQRVLNDQKTVMAMVAAAKAAKAAAAARALLDDKEGKSGGSKGWSRSDKTPKMSMSEVVAASAPSSESLHGDEDSVPLSQSKGLKATEPIDLLSPSQVETLKATEDTRSATIANTKRSHAETSHSNSRSVSPKPNQ